MEEILVKRLSAGLVTPAALVDLLYDNQGDYTEVRLLLSCFKAGFLNKFNSEWCKCFYLAAQTPQRRELFFKMYNFPENLFKIPLEKIREKDYFMEDRRFTNRRVKTKKKKKRVGVISTFLQDNILLHIQRDYRRGSGLFRSREDTHISRQIMDRLMVNVRRGKVSPIELLEWVAIVHRFSSADKRDKFCCSLLDAQWKAIECLYVDWIDKVEAFYSREINSMEDVLFE